MIMMMDMMMMMMMIMTIYFVRVCPPGRISTGWTDRLPAMVVSTIIVITVITVMSSIVIITTTITNIGWIPCQPHHCHILYSQNNSNRISRQRNRGSPPGWQLPMFVWSWSVEALTRSQSSVWVRCPSRVVLVGLVLVELLQLTSAGLNPETPAEVSCSNASSTKKKRRW